MCTKPGEDLDEEYLDDPITLIDLRHDGEKEADRGIIIEDLTIDTDESDSDSGGNKDLICTSSYGKRNFLLPVTFFDISRNVKLLHECRPLSIKVVDCDKHLWYYKKSHDHLKIDSNASKAENVFPKTLKVDTNMKALDLNSSVKDAISVSDEMKKKLKAIVDISIKSREQNILEVEKPSNETLEKTVQYLKHMKEVHKQNALKQKDLKNVDFRKNKGLVGLKITMKGSKIKKINGNETFEQTVRKQVIFIENTLTVHDNIIDQNFGKNVSVNENTLTDNKIEEHVKQDTNDKSALTVDNNKNEVSGSEIHTEPKLNSESKPKSITNLVRTNDIDKKQSNENMNSPTRCSLKINCPLTLKKAKKLKEGVKANSSKEKSKWKVKKHKSPNKDIHGIPKLNLKRKEKVTKTYYVVTPSQYTNDLVSDGGTKNKIKLGSKESQEKPGKDVAGNTSPIIPCKTMTMENKERKSMSCATSINSTVLNSGVIIDRPLPTVATVWSSQTKIIHNIMSEAAKIHPEVINNNTEQIGANLETFKGKQQNTAGLCNETVYHENNNKTLSTNKCISVQNIMSKTKENQNENNNYIRSANLNSKNTLDQNKTLPKSTNENHNQVRSDPRFGNVHAPSNNLLPPGSRLYYLNALRYPVIVRRPQMHKLNDYNYGQPIPSIVNYRPQSYIQQSGKPIRFQAPQFFPPPITDIMPGVNPPVNKHLVTDSNSNVTNVNIKPSQENALYRFDTVYRGPVPDYQCLQPRPTPPPYRPAPEHYSNLMPIDQSSILGSNADGELIKKINIAANPVSPAEKNNKVLTEKEQMLANLNKSIDEISIESVPVRKESNKSTGSILSECLSLSNNLKRSTAAILQPTPKRDRKYSTPCPLSKKVNSAKNEAACKTKYDKNLIPEKLTQKSSYSPPILPILPYEKSLEIWSQRDRQKTSYTAKKLKKKQESFAVRSGIDSMFSHKTKPVAAAEKIAVKRKHVATASEKEAKASKKISLEEYKKRILKDGTKIKSAHPRGKPNEKRSKVQWDESNRDLGYDSDSTVKL